MRDDEQPRQNPTCYPDRDIENADWPKRTPDTPEALGLGPYYHGPGPFKLDPDAPAPTPENALRARRSPDLGSGRGKAGA